MKTLYFDGEEYQAEKFIKTEDSIIGVGGDAPKFRGISDFSQFQLAEGQDWDKDEIAELKQQVADLEMFILIQEGIV